MKRDEKKRALEQHIYDSAIDLFCEQGYTKTTLIDIANEAGVSTRTLYKYFRSKDSILRKFTRDNITSIKVFAQQAPADMPLFDKIIEMMVYDYKQMFCLFDISFIIHGDHEKDKDDSQLDFENLLVTQAIYYSVLEQEQLKKGARAGINTRIAATVLVGQYRMVCDQFRYLDYGTFDEDRFRALLRMHLEPIWDSLYESLFKPDSESNQRYFDVADYIHAVTKASKDSLKKTESEPSVS